MAILNFQKPDKVIMIESTDFDGKFEFRPLEPGYGLTVGNALRRVLLSSLEGFAITSIRIEGVDHEFSVIPGVVEDVTEMILNLKQVRFIQEIEEEFQVTLLDKMNVTFKQGEFLAYKSLSDFRKMAKDKAVSANTIVFNNLVENKEEFETHWEVPASDSWHSRFL